MTYGKTSIHYDWLRLIEVSGPFLSATVLDEAFPNGLDGFDRRVKRDLARFYAEWVEAAEQKRPEFHALHLAWIRAVLCDGLELPTDDLEDGAAWEVSGEGGIGRFVPDWGLKGLDGAPALFIKALPANVKPTDKDADDAWTDTHVEKMTRLCRAQNVRIGLVTNGEQWTLVNAAPSGTLSGTATWHARLWFQEDSTLRAFISLLGYHRFTAAARRRLPALFDESLNHLEEVTDTLGKQVRTAVEVLLEGLDRADLDSGRTLLRGVPPQTLYEASLTVMMRLVFILCAEERGLLLLGEKAYDDVYAISTLRQQLEEDADRFGEEVLERRFDAWIRILGTFRAIYGGIDHPALRLPALGGSLFDPDKYPFLEGRQPGEPWRGPSGASGPCPLPLPIDNRTVLLLLESLQVLKHKGGAIPLSFRSLDVEQIGYIYEGLLEFTGARAETTLLGLKGDKSHPNPEVSLAELESLRLDDEGKLLDYVAEVTGRTAIAREYDSKPDDATLPLLLKVCRGDETLRGRVLPFANWLRLSEWGEPVVYHKDSFYVTEGQDRRSSGTHYTPKALTEMVVKEALEPVVYVGPAQGTPRTEWKLKSPAELLDLKVCDIAMGSGAFLVQACRYLADRLVDSWAESEKAGKAIASDGTVTEYPPNDPMSNVPDDRLCEARRLVAEKCLYGVDINPLAVELAKLSLWLVTISKGRPFGFYDHNLKSGDSLLGVSDIRQLTQFRMKPDVRHQGILVEPQIQALVAQAAAEREEIRRGRERDINDVAIQMQHHKKAQELVARVRDLADYFIGNVFVLGKPSKKTDAALHAASMNASAILDPAQDSSQACQLHQEIAQGLSYDLPDGKSIRHPFHWAIEFPEVFANGGFDAICGNPPFMGGRHIRGNFGKAYREYLVNNIANEVNGAADLVAYFYLRAYSFISRGGTFNLIACNTIAEGDTRQVGLERLVEDGASIIAAHPNMPWPGSAAVAISPVLFYKPGCVWNGRYALSDSIVPVISPFLTSEEAWSPLPLAKNINQAFQGSLILGMGFTMSSEEAQHLIAEDEKNSDVLLPYLNGEDLNSDPLCSASRWVINFYDWSECHSKEYTGVFKIVEERVKPEREEKSHKQVYKDIMSMWWRHWNARPMLYHKIGQGERFEKHPNCDMDAGVPGYVLASVRVTKYYTVVRLPSRQVFSDRLIVLIQATFTRLAILSSMIFESWVRHTGSTLETRLLFNPTDCYETFPFPIRSVLEGESLGEQFDKTRRSVMISDRIGLTQLYNRFHDPAENDPRIVEMRALQVKIDTAVRDAYGWQDIELAHDFHEVEYLPANDNVRYTISEEARIEILKRLAKLNKERWEEEEAAGLHKKGRKK